MNETMMTIVGNVLNEPECRLLEQSQQMVTHFKVIATSRRYDRAEARWVDGDSLRLRVTCWRQLAENVARSVHLGDPVLVTGRLTSRTWESEDHTKRTSYELEASSVGHDLARGRAKFARVRVNTLTSTIDDELAEKRIAGQLSQPVAAINGLPRRREYDGELGGYATTVVEHPDQTRDPFAEDYLTEIDEAVSAAFDIPADAALAGASLGSAAAEVSRFPGAPQGDPGLSGAQRGAEAQSGTPQGATTQHGTAQGAAPVFSEADLAADVAAEATAYVRSMATAAGEPADDDSSAGESDTDEGAPGEPDEVSAAARRKRARGGRVPVGV